LLDGKADLVIASRYITGGSTPGWPMWRKALSRLAAALAYPITGVHDSMCGFFAMPRNLLLELSPAATGFKIAFETLVQGGKNLRVAEIPIAFRDRSRGVSKMSFGVAFIFALRWVAAVTRTLWRGQERAARLDRHSSIANPAKSSKVANNALP
jgi:dolichol-phosphate mannosyltransferase